MGQLPQVTAGVGRVGWNPSEGVHRRRHLPVDTSIPEATHRPSRQLPAPHQSYVSRCQEREVGRVDLPTGVYRTTGFSFKALFILNRQHWAKIGNSCSGVVPRKKLELIPGFINL